MIPVYPVWRVMSKCWPHLLVAERVDKQPLSFQLLFYSGQAWKVHSELIDKEKELTLFWPDCQHEALPQREEPCTLWGHLENISLILYGFKSLLLLRIVVYLWVGCECVCVWVCVSLCVCMSWFYHYSLGKSLSPWVHDTYYLRCVRDCRSRHTHATLNPRYWPYCLKKQRVQNGLVETHATHTLFSAHLSLFLCSFGDLEVTLLDYSSNLSPVPSSGLALRNPHLILPALPFRYQWPPYTAFVPLP